MTYLDMQGRECEYEFLTKDTSITNGLSYLSDITENDQFIGFLHLDKRSLPDGKSRYRIKYELLRDNQGNHKIFEIKEVNLAVKPIHDLYSTNTDAKIDRVTAYYLTLREDYYPEDLLSEIYYRNSAGHAYADDSIYKVGPKQVFRNHKKDKILDTHILNKEVLNKLLLEYGPEWPVGNDTSFNPDNPDFDNIKSTANFCGYLGEIDIANMPDISGNTVDATSRYHGIRVS